MPELPRKKKCEVKKFVILMILFVIGARVSHCATPIVSMKYQMMTDSVVLTIRYHNTTTDTLVFWMQNWSLKLLESNDEAVKGFPYSSNLVNFIYISNLGVDVFKNIGYQKYHASIGDMVETKSLKKLVPGEAFVVQIISKDRGLMSFLDKGNVRLSMILSVAPSKSLRKSLGMWEYLCLLPDQLRIGHLPVRGNTSRDIGSNNYVFSNVQLDVKVPLYQINALFQKVICENVSFVKG